MRYISGAKVMIWGSVSVVICVIAYFIRDWRTLLGVCGGISASTLLLLIAQPESARRVYRYQNKDKG